MSTTTQILFNSPALHALKRDQLVKLCKIHSIKASGKNVDLIDRLKHHAQTLPRDSPLSVASRSEDPGAVTSDQDHDNAIDNEKPTQDNDAEDDGGSGWKFQMPRPSEQWEVVMESIEELEENSSQGTLSSTRTLGSTGEFGTGNSKSTTVTSSIKALANSLGFKRIASTSANSTRSNNTFSSSMSSSSSSKLLNSFPHPPPIDELTHHSTPYASLPPTDPTIVPQTDHFVFNPSDRSAPLDSSHNYSFTTEKHHDANPHAPFNFTPDPTPLPGHTLRPGLPAPTNARLSLGLGPSTPTSNKSGPTTTIRLISNPIFPNTDRFNDPATPQLKPFETTFDLVLGSPAGIPIGGAWPREEEAGEKQEMYPALPVDALPADGDGDVDMPGALSLTPPHTPAPASTLAPPPAPFIFGSPLPQHNLSNTQFRSAAASVLEEMNRRLREDGVEGVEMDLLAQRQGWGGGGDGERVMKPLPGGKEGFGLRERFERAHEEEFRKMESIAGFVGRRGEGAKCGEGDVLRVGKKRKSSVLGRDRGGPRRPSGVRSVAGVRVISNGRRKKAAVPGAFGDEDSEDSEKVEEEARGKRARVDNDGEKGDARNETQEEEEVDEEKRQKERDAIRRKLEMNKARRRSSMGVAGKGRVSLGGKSVLHKPKPSRFGFLSSAKSIVQNVWNRGKAPAAAASNIPVSKPLAHKHAPFQPVKKVSIAPTLASAPGRPSTSLAGAKPSRAPSMRLTKDKEKDKGGLTSTTSSRARSPIPSFTGAPAPSISASGSSSRVASSIGTSSRVGSRNSSITGPASSSSIGTRSSVATRSSAGFGFGSGSRVSSLGTRGSVGRGADVGSTGSKVVTGTSERKRVLSSSRLLAPTASSLAKGGAAMRTGISTGLSAVAEDRSVAERHTFAAVAATTSQAVPSTLQQITNSPTATGRLVPPQSSRPGGIFSKPLTLPGSPSSIPTSREAPSSFIAAGTALAGPGFLEAKKCPAPASASASQPKQKVLAGRKPRISRSKVIAKLASQRAASGHGSGSGAGSNAGGSGSGGGRSRSSLGAKVQRQSYGGGKAGARVTGDVMMSAKKRARQSEYARRRSRAAGGSSVGVGGAGRIVDD